MTNFVTLKCVDGAERAIRKDSIRILEDYTGPDDKKVTMVTLTDGTQFCAIKSVAEILPQLES